MRPGIGRDGECMPESTAFLIAAILGQYIFLIRNAAHDGRVDEWKKMMEEWRAMVEEWRMMVDKKIWSVSK